VDPETPEPSNLPKMSFQAQRDSMDSISMSRLCKSQAAVGGAIDEISSRLIVFDYRNTQPRVRQ
jgi:hypothetical protein